MSFDARSRRRIAATVRGFEATPPVSSVQSPAGRIPLSSGDDLIGVVQEDIEHGEIGTVNLATVTGSSFDDTVSEITSRQFECFNPGLKVFDGAWCVLRHAGYAETSHRNLIITTPFSSRVIRGVASADIAAGATGTLSQVTAFDGQTPGATVTVANPTGSGADISASEVVVADLAYGTLSGTPASDWIARKSVTGTSTTSPEYAGIEDRSSDATIVGNAGANTNTSAGVCSYGTLSHPSNLAGIVWSYAESDSVRQGYLELPPGRTWRVGYGGAARMRTGEAIGHVVFNLEYGVSATQGTKPASTSLDFSVVCRVEPPTAGISNYNGVTSTGLWQQASGVIVLPSSGSDRLWVRMLAEYQLTGSPTPGVQISNTYLYADRLR